jgi:hypothetical protein
VELAASPDCVFFLRVDDVPEVLVAGAMFFVVDFLCTRFLFCIMHICHA